MVLVEAWGRPTDYDVCSIEVPNSETENSGPIHRYPGPVPPMLAYEGCQTLYELFRKGVREHPENPFLGHRPIDSEGNAGPYVFESYGEVARRIDNFASGLVYENLISTTPEGVRLIGIQLKNRPEWIMSEQAAYSLGAATVPIYDTLGPDVLSYVVNQTELGTVICGVDELQANLAAAPMCPSLKAVVVVTDALTDTQRRMAANVGLRIFTFTDLERVGFCYPQRHRPPSGRDIATFSYTSGTTGDPKGALLTHQNFISIYAAAKSVDVLGLTNDVHFSYLPLAHVFERAVQVGVIGTKGCIGFWQGTPEKLVDDLQALRPTTMPSVPRVLNRMYDKVMQGVEQSSNTRKKIFRMAYEAQLKNFKAGKSLKTFWDRLVFAKIRRMIGLDRIKVMVTGSAPIAPHVLTFMRIMVGGYVFEGYGQTENTAMATLTFPGDTSCGHVGGISPVCEIKLEDVPEMGYYHTDRFHGAAGNSGKPPIRCRGRGEVLVRGPNVFLGYYKMPDKTAEAIDKDGWLHSGDIGLWTPEGKLMIIDRKKNIFKLSQGEYVAAEKIENVNSESAFIAQNFVHGDSLKSQLVAIIVPEEETCMEWAAANGLAGISFADLCQRPKMRAKILEEIENCGKRAGLHGFEIARAVHLETQPFSVQNSMLTPTQKLRRTEARRHYEAILEGLYSELDAVAGEARARL